MNKKLLSFFISAALVFQAHQPGRYHLIRQKIHLPALQPQKMMTPRYGGGLAAAPVLLQLSPLLSAAEAAVVVEMTMTTSMTTMIMWSTTLSMVSGRRALLSG